MNPARGWRWLVAAVVPAVFIGAFIAGGRALGPYAIDAAMSFRPPGSVALLGTDLLGRDLAARTLYATGLTSALVLQSALVALLVAVVLGALAGRWWGRLPDLAVRWAVGMGLSIPTLLLLVGIFAVVPATPTRTFIAIGCICGLPTSLLVRAEVRRLMASPLILAERAAGFTEAAILLRSVLPLTLPVAIVSLVYLVPELIGLEVGLSFFGLGAAPPTPTLGRLLFDGISEAFAGWWLPTAPAVAMVIVVAAASGYGRWVRSVLRVPGIRA